MTAEVLTALQILKDNAENDFERHRISVLENDLTNPPRVEVLDDKHQRFNGIIFRKRKEGHYFHPNYSIYREVWHYYRGALPKNTIIHHIDHDKDNNNIENLVPMTPSDHRHLHADAIPSIEVTLICSNCGKNYITKYCGQKTFLCPDCRKIQTKPLISKICAWCGKEFKTKNKNAQCCSNSCSNRLTYFKRTGKTAATKERVCIFCGKTFSIPSSHKHSSHRLTCSEECLHNYLSKIHKPKTYKKCVICGKEFYSHHKSTLTCSKECTTKLAFPNAEHIKVNCEICGKEISCFKSNPKRFCSRDCFNKSIRTKIIRQCAFCGNSFEIYPKSKVNYCSTECKKKLQAANRPIKIDKQKRQSLSVNDCLSCKGDT